MYEEISVDWLLSDMLYFKGQIVLMKVSRKLS